MEKYNNKYRIPSARRPNWDYSSAGAYFITICTQNREHYFDKIADGKMRFSNIGIIAGILWTQIPFHNNNVELGAFVVMPNHIHGILMIGSLSSPGGDSAKISPKSNSISAIIRSYKSAVTKYAHRYGFEFQWQDRFHDHIIRDDQSFQNISGYIINNPSNWQEDKFFKSQRQ